MSSTRQPFDDSVSEFENIEEIIYLARNYVVPSDDLRPRTLDEAKEHGQKRREMQRLFFATLACIALWCLSLGVVNSASAYRDDWVAPGGDKLQKIAFELAAKSHSSPEWGLVEVFLRMRNLRACDFEPTPVVEVEIDPALRD